jgi:hypothetical protein
MQHRTSCQGKTPLARQPSITMYPGIKLNLQPARSFLAIPALLFSNKIQVSSPIS